MQTVGSNTKLCVTCAMYNGSRVPKEHFVNLVAENAVLNFRKAQMLNRVIPALYGLNGRHYAEYGEIPKEVMREAQL